MPWFPNSPDFNSVKHLQNTHKNKKTVGIKQRERLGCTWSHPSVLMHRSNGDWLKSWLRKENKPQLSSPQRFKKRKKVYKRCTLTHWGFSGEIKLFLFHSPQSSPLSIMTSVRSTTGTKNRTNMNRIIPHCWFFWCIFKLIVCKTLSSTYSLPMC